MNKMVMIVAIAAVAGSASASAQPDGACRKHHRWDLFASKACVTVPEIDPASAFAGLTLLAGSVAVLTSRRRRDLNV